jgi:hypothetical protein
VGTECAIEVPSRAAGGESSAPTIIAQGVILVGTRESLHATINFFRFAPLKPRPSPPAPPPKKVAPKSAPPAPPAPPAPLRSAMRGESPRAVPGPGLLFSLNTDVAVFINGEPPCVLYTDPLAPTAHSLQCVAFLDKHRYLNSLPLYFTWKKLNEAIAVADTVAAEVLGLMFDKRAERPWF